MEITNRYVRNVREQNCNVLSKFWDYLNERNNEDDFLNFYRRESNQILNEQYEMMEQIHIDDLNCKDKEKLILMKSQLLELLKCAQNYSIFSQLKEKCGNELRVEIYLEQLCISISNIRRIIYFFRTHPSSHHCKFINEKAMKNLDMLILKGQEIQDSILSELSNQEIDLFIDLFHEFNNWYQNLIEEYQVLNDIKKLKTSSFEFEKLSLLPFSCAGIVLLCELGFIYNSYEEYIAIFLFFLVYCVALHAEKSFFSND